MKAMKNIAIFVLALLLLTGCQAKPAADSADSEVDAVREWFTAAEPDYALVSTDTVKEGVYALLETFTPPGVEEGYTIVSAYIVAAEDGGNIYKGIGDTYGSGSIGFSAEVLSTEEATVLFGDIGSSLYDPTTDTRRDVTFTEVAAKLADGSEVAIPVQNNAPYILILDAGAEVSDAVFRTEDEELLYSACYGKPVTYHSAIYTDAAIENAMAAVTAFFETEFRGCTLTELRYPGDALSDLFTQWAREYRAYEAIVLYSTFDTNASGGDGSLEPNTTYEDFQWILVRDSGGTWEVKTYGYG